MIVTLGDDHPLVGDEHLIAASLGPARKRELAAGRTALRTALAELAAPSQLDASTLSAQPILADDRGAPILPAGFVGSISHKAERAAGLVAPAGRGFVGLDIELAAPPRMPIERRILTPREQAHVSGRDVTLYFSIKEAIYKAIDPIVRRYVGFTEIELDVRSDGSVSVTVLDATRLPVEIEASWLERDGYWLATARGRRR
ncbi:MAG TPA: 4'-phosphopantetheinyl transferase superfamily protein [Kofleriaceae bacterium]|nr:4'-phosphopantetheinyl transferase superfamily protein [Kofleriaceae bacterium]